jgi:membrane protease YdiL (CAAX protease family)
MNNDEERRPASQQPAYRNPAEPYLQQTASSQAAYGSSLYSAPQDAGKQARSLLRSAGNSASLIPIIYQLLAVAVLILILIGWFIANVGRFFSSIKANRSTEEFVKMFNTPEDMSTYLFLSVIATICAALLTILITRSILHRNVKEQWKKPSLSIPEFIKYFMVALGIGGIGVFFNIGLQTLCKYYNIKITAPNFSLGDNAAQNTVLLLYVCLVGPILEEILFRGLVLQSLRPWGDKLAIIVSGVLFGLMHMNLLQGIPVAVLGIFFAYVTVKSGSIIPTVILHILYNTIPMIFEVCGVETNEALQTGYLIFYGVMILVGVILIVTHRIPFHEISKQAAPNVSEPEHPYRVVFLQSAAFWVLVVTFIVNSFYPAIVGSLLPT